MQLKRNKEMEFETLKKNYKKEIIIGALIVCVIGGALTFNLTRAKYKVTDSIDLARGTVNYSVPDLRVVAIKTSEDGINYTDVEEAPASGYTLNTTNSICKISTDAKDDNITIEYKDGKVNILGVSKRNTRCYLYFDKYVPPIPLSTIVTNIASTSKTTKPIFSNVATTDEGIYSLYDNTYNGTSYYWRGAVINNYVQFAGFCWRIVRINGDNTMRLIYDGAICHANGTVTTESVAKSNIKYNELSNQSNYAGWTYSGTSQRTLSGTSSNAKKELEDWYSINITGTHANMVANGKFCNDRESSSWSISPSSDFYYSALNRRKSSDPSLYCYSGDTYTLKVGLLTMDEVMYAGGNSANNSLYYLYNGQNYWTMSPSFWYSGGNTARVFYVNSDGYLSGSIGVSSNCGLRPVINLKSDTKFEQGGDGTLNNPYIVAN